jgi:nucleoside-diphosphate-sugar epimerase
LGEFSAAILKRLPNATHRFEPDPDVERVLAGWPGDLDDSHARRDWGWRHRYDLEATAADFLGVKA